MAFHWPQCNTRVYKEKACSRFRWRLKSLVSKYTEKQYQMCKMCTWCRAFVTRAAPRVRRRRQRYEHRQAAAFVYLRAIVVCKESVASRTRRPMRKIAALTVLPSARAACSVSIAARGMKTLSCPFGSGTSGDTASSLVMQCNRLSPMSDGSVLASYGATSGAVPTRPRMPATPRLNKNECKAAIAVLATAAVAEDFGWGGRWSSPTVSYRERAFAYVKPCTRTETL